MSFERFRAATAIKRILTRSPDGATEDELELEFAESDLDPETFATGLDDLLEKGDIAKRDGRYYLGGSARAGRQPAAAAKKPTQPQAAPEAAKPPQAKRFRPGERELCTLGVLREAGGPLKTREITDRTGIPKNNIGSVLAKLVSKNKVKKIGYGEYAIGDGTAPAAAPAKVAKAKPKTKAKALKPAPASGDLDDPIAAQLRDMAVVARKALEAFINERCAGATYDALRNNAERADEALARHTWERG